MATNTRYLSVASYSCFVRNWARGELLFSEQLMWNLVGEVRILVAAEPGQDDGQPDHGDGARKFNISGQKI